MKNLRAIVLLCVLALACSQTVTTTSVRGDEFNNPEFVKVLNNYFGCKTWDNGICVECSDHYYFNENGVCCEVKPQCKNFNRQVGICEACYQGYGLVNGVCVRTDLINSEGAGCKTWIDGKCSECSNRWYFNSNNVCTPVSDLCRTWTSTGNCETCYPGYVVAEGQCISDPNIFRPAQDDLCATWKDRTCIKCADRAYFDANGVCRGVSTQCATWDLFDGLCLTCYHGYDLIKGQCVVSPIAQPTDLGCKIWDWNKQVCLECSARWTFNSKGVCVPVSDNCNQWDASGACTACYKGYELVKGQCVQSAVQQPTDLGCKTWDWDRQVCLECSARWTFNSKGVCVPVSDNCNQWDASGACTACYKGYELVKGQCVQSAVQQPTDLGCKTWDWNKQVCLECSARWTFNSKGVCVPVSDNCNQWDASGACTACYTGYQLSHGQCQLANTLCKSFNSSGACASCFNGYVLYQNNCTPISKLADIVLYYSACCPEKLEQLKKEGRL